MIRRSATVPPIAFKWANALLSIRQRLMEGRPE
jgi:hypothetical protein